MKRRLPSHFLNRELSWLEFNRRVLEEAQDSKNPLLERIRFYCIFHSNLDEFFMVRVASLMRQVREAKRKPDPSGLAPGEQLRQVLARVKELHRECAELYPRLLEELAREKIRVLGSADLDEAGRKYLEDYFERELYPVMTPVAIGSDRIVSRLPGLALMLAVLVRSRERTEEEPRLAVLQLPSRIPGLCRLPAAEGAAYCWIADAARLGLDRLFPGNEILECAAFRITRDSEVELDDEGREDYVRMLESEIKKRRHARPVRMEFESAMPVPLQDKITEILRAGDGARIVSPIPLDPKPLFALADLPGFDRLRYKPQPPLMPAVLGQERSLFDLIREEDLLLSHPYDSFDPVVELLQAAAEDADVLAIKQTLYRTSGMASPLVQALARAARNGKDVTVLLELTARFDEERNISWARDLEEAGVHVLYGIAGLKVHAKITLVVRRESGGIRRYLHLGTGNYNERTARGYTDFGLLTAAEELGRDASGVFNAMTGYSETPVLTHMVMAPLGMRERIVALIRREADWASAGQKSGIQAKMNSLVDPAIIEALYRAGRAGVSIRLNVRGICCLRPGVSGLSENIRVVSIVDRYLEHSRAFVFHNGGSPEAYLSSADWMPRNLDRRIELMFPVLHETARDLVVEALEAQFRDNQKARVLRPDGKYERSAVAKTEAYRAQEGLYRIALARREGAGPVAPVRFTPIKAKE